MKISKVGELHSFWKGTGFVTFLSLSYWLDTFMTSDQKKEKKKVKLLEILASATDNDPKGAQLFDLIDTNGDGKLSRKELLAGLTKQVQCCLLLCVVRFCHVPSYPCEHHVRG